MKRKRSVEIFSAGCPACAETVELVHRLACPSCEITVADMHQSDVASRAKALGIRSLPAIVIDGQVAACCAGTGIDEGSLRSSGVGQPLP
jgi:glutaredoxin